jgi:hypothetical protein
MFFVIAEKKIDQFDFVCRGCSLFSIFLFISFPFFSWNKTKTLTAS